MQNKLHPSFIVKNYSNRQKKVSEFHKDFVEKTLKLRK